ncbi:LYR motif-containing protein 4 isoform X6 [Bubalus kerabau]|uniref:LYR motif-containing protein 4 isoform X6 n=1 Tax=Bubalus carabanensis TaxID=3119969 RepID=UPI00244EF106|nr:LYR motif-containing protein 4 isoform X6 [Bubalus carabanensis]
MAASSRAQVLDLYRAMLRESKRFGAYNYRCYSQACFRKSGMSLPASTAPSSRSTRRRVLAEVTDGSNCSLQWGSSQASSCLF